MASSSVQSSEGVEELAERASVLDQVSRHAIVPELVEDCETRILIDWQIGNIKVHAGMFLLPEESASQASLVLHATSQSSQDNLEPARPNQLYSVLIVDPDAPLGLDQVLHGAVFNCRLGCNVFDPSQGGVILQAHRGAGPPANSGKHRYVALAFEQQMVFQASLLKRHVQSLCFDVAAAASALQLGVPVGINFYVSEYDGSCWLALMSALLCRCCARPPPADWFERAEAKILQGS